MIHVPFVINGITCLSQFVAYEYVKTTVKLLDRSLVNFISVIWFQLSCSYSNGRGQSGQDIDNYCRPSILDSSCKLLICLTKLPWPLVTSELCRRCCTLLYIYRTYQLLYSHSQSPAPNGFIPHTPSRYVRKRPNFCQL